MDPWKPVNKAIISHGHADHAPPGMKHYLCHQHAKSVLQHRLGADIKVQTLAYNEPLLVNGVQVSFHPAGHTIGSAQIRLEHKGEVVVFTGDYKVKDDHLTQAFEPVKCHTFITESTFGLPIYRWETEDVLKKQLEDWILYNTNNQKTSVFFGYSLGKAQRIMKLLEGLGKVYVHEAIYNINEAMKKDGIKLPEVELISKEMNLSTLDGQLIILPPALLDSKMIKKIPNVATALCSGWMQVRGNRRWRGADAGFAISDHADWEGLLYATKESRAEKVYVTHGYSEVFSRYLNEIGVHAEVLETSFEDNDANTEES